ncbi:MAG: hypothetical protein KGY67_08215 [Candidatus Thermoplasmatota archaeon]|nr:hypothetical protein [Candidatus Thermoplasmatota archaeon]
MRNIFSVLLSFFLFIVLVSTTVLSEQGDANNDGEITTDDVIIILEMAAGKQIQDLSLDMNNDGMITSLDAYQVLEQINTTDPLVEELTTVVKRYDLGEYFSDERMNWKVKKTDGESLHIAVVVENGDIVEFYEGKIKDPSINAYTSEKTIRNLLDAKNSQSIRDAWSNGDIQIEGVGMGNAIRIGFMGFVNWVTAPFS